MRVRILLPLCFCMFSVWSDIISVGITAVTDTLSARITTLSEANGWALAALIFEVCLFIIILIYSFFIDWSYKSDYWKKNRFFKKFIYYVRYADDTFEEWDELMVELTYNVKVRVNALTRGMLFKNYKKKDPIEMSEWKLQYFAQERARIIEKRYNSIIFWAKVRRKFYSNFEFLNNNSYLNFYRTYYRMTSSHLRGFYRNLSFNLTRMYEIWKATFLMGLVENWYAIRIWLIPLIIHAIVLTNLTSIRLLPFNKTVFVWLVVGFFAYWLISGFVSFIKKYQFSKFTSAIQRFWRRGFILFWLIEFSLFSVFFYLTLNSNNESWYMYDQLQVFKTGLFSWRSFLSKLFPLTLLVVTTYLLMLTLKWNTAPKHTLWLLLLTIVLLYIVWLEFYQFFHVVNFYGNFGWIFDPDERVWSLELELRKSRTVNHYVMLMIMLKFWHIVVIFVMWVFFVLRVLEIGRIRYALFSANLQNFMILYLFAWVLMFPWLKFAFRKFLEGPYYWFYVNNRRLGFRLLQGDSSLFYFSFFKSCYFNLMDFFGVDFFYTARDDEFVSDRKASTKNTIASQLYYL